MRRIVMFNPDRVYKDSLNIFAKLARSGKKVLVLDLRQSTYKMSGSPNGFNITTCLEGNKSCVDYVESLEPNLDIIRGSTSLQTAEFRIFDSLFRFDVFDKQLEGLDYDYIIFEVSFVLDLLTLNALFVSSEVFIFHDYTSTVSYDVCKFLKDFNSLYSHKVLCSLVIATYKGTLDESKYTSLVSDFSTDIVSFPFKLEKSSSEYKNAIENIAKKIIETEAIFSPTKNMDWALEKQKEYQQILNRISSQ